MSFITHDGPVKILGFGLAKLIVPQHSDGNSAVDTETLLRIEDGKVLGTVAYMSPEQVRGQH